LLVLSTVLLVCIEDILLVDPFLFCIVGGGGLFKNEDVFVCEVGGMIDLDFREEGFPRISIILD